MKNYDLIIIGFGKAGKTIASKIASDNYKVAVIEKDSSMYGGTCINVGCLPTKSFTHSSKVINEMKDLGLLTDYEINNKFYKKALEEKVLLVKKLNKVNFDMLNNNKNVDVINKTAKFISNYEISLIDNNKTEEIITSKNIIINTGAKAFIPNIEGINDSKLTFTSKGILNLENLPKELLIIGSGYIGLEFASYFSNFGSNVTVLESYSDFLPREDKEDSYRIKKVLEEKGIKFLFNVNIKKIYDKFNKVIVEYIIDEKLQVQEFDNILVATGRKPNTQDLGLENTDIKLGKNNEILVNDDLETNVKNIFAVGDVKGGPQFTFISLDDSRILLPKLLNKDSKYNLENRKIYATTTFIDPPFSRIGATEKELDSKNIKYRKFVLETAKIPKSHVIRQTKGYTKILVSEDDLILGASIFNYESHEMINILTLAINEKIKFTKLRDLIYTHPTFTESLNDVFSNEVK